MMSVPARGKWMLGWSFLSLSLSSLCVYFFLSFFFSSRALSLMIRFSPGVLSLFFPFLFALWRRRQDITYTSLFLSLFLSMFVAKAAAAAAASTNYFYSLYRETGAFPSFRLQLTNCGAIKNARCCCCFSCPFPFLFSSFGYPASSLMVNANQRERETTIT